MDTLIYFNLDQIQSNLIHLNAKPGKNVLMTSSWFRETELGVEIFLYCQPGSKKTEVQGIYGERLKIRLAAPPVDGKANEILIAWLASELGIPKAKIQLTHGFTGRQKRLQIVGGTLEQIQALQKLVS